MLRFDHRPYTKSQSRLRRRDFLRALPLPALGLGESLRAILPSPALAQIKAASS